MSDRIIIIGSGPAGMSAAFFLSLKEGTDITVLERLGDSQYARYHNVCGGGISRKTFVKLAPMVPSGILNEIHRTHIIWPSGNEIVMRTEGYILDRPAFLSDVRKQCIGRGVRFVKDTAVGVSYDGQYRVSCSSGKEYSCDWLIGADGACSVVRKDVFGSSPVLKVPATECLVERKSQDHLSIRLIADGSGTYTWEFPRGDLTGTGGMKGYSEKDAVFKGSRFIPVGGVGPIVKGRAALAGDAAAMANPISYGGLKAALLAGKKVAEAIWEGDLGTYQKWWSSSILSDRRFMEFNEKLRSWSEEDMEKAARPFRHGGIYLPGIWACITQPKNIGMYFGCLFAFRYGW